jgi:hypothetical protein
MNLELFNIITYIVYLVIFVFIYKLWKYYTKEKAVEQPVSNECPGCEKKKREGAAFCNICGRSL